MKSEKLEIFAERSRLSSHIDVGIFRKTTTNVAQIEERALPLAWCPMSPDAWATHFEPTLSLSSDAAQQLMDELWRVGVRPTAGAGSAGQLAAVERHLEDMRTLVFKTPARS